MGRTHGLGRDDGVEDEVVMTDLFEIHKDPPEGTPYGIRPETPAVVPGTFESPKQTSEPMVYLSSSGRFRVVLSYKDREGVWQQKVQTVSTMKKARRLRGWWKAIGRTHAESR